MAASSNKKQKHILPEGNVEERINARAVSRGLAIGRIVCLYGRKRQFYRIEISDSQIEREIRRFRAAVRLAAEQLKKIETKKTGVINKTQADIFSAQLLILVDKSLHSKVETIIETEKINAEWAVKIVTEELTAKYKTIPDDHLRERYIDLEDVADRILTALGGGGNPTIRLDKNSIIVAKEVKPSTLIELAESQPQAIITENGGWTSHTFILAREMSLPAVTGVKRILRQVQNGDEVIVDGFRGQVILNPQKNTVENYISAVEEFRQSKSAKIETKIGVIKTLDGREVTIRANLDSPKGYGQAKKLGAKGVGYTAQNFFLINIKVFQVNESRSKLIVKSLSWSAGKACEFARSI